MEVKQKDRNRSKFHDSMPTEYEYLRDVVFNSEGFSIEDFGKKDKKFHTPKRKKAEKDWQDAI